MLSKEEVLSNSSFWEFIAPEARREYESRNAVYTLMVEITNKCAGSCSFCFSSSTTSLDHAAIPTEKVLQLLDEAHRLDIQEFVCTGGDALAHSDWMDIVRYAKGNGMSIFLGTSMLISKNVAKQICQLGVDLMCAHIDSIRQDVYNKVHTNPKTLEKKIEGYQNMLEAGFPPERMIPLLTLTKPVMDSIEETIDWYVDDMRVKAMALIPLKGEGFGKEIKYLEPGMSEFKRAYEYRAKKLGPEWLRLGTCDLGKYFCKTHICVHTNGQVAPCNVQRELGVGNIYQESLEDIIERHRNHLLFNFEIKGVCGHCQYNDLCIGCRANSYYYTGNLQYSDPKCFLNPNNTEEYCYQEARA